MSRLPLETWDVSIDKSRPLYVHNAVCAAPGCTDYSKERHHAWRRSFGANGWWVHVPKYGRTFPNIIGLCEQHHSVLDRALGGQGAFIVISTKTFQWYWITREDWDRAGKNDAYARPEEWGRLLDPQPGPAGFRNEPATWAQIESHAVMGDRVFDMHTGEDITITHLPNPGETCSTCKRRVPHPKKEGSPDTKVVSFRVPADEVDSFTEVLEAAAAHAGLREGKFHKYKLFLRALVLVLQEPGGS